MYEARQRKEKVSRTLSPLKQRDIEQTHEVSSEILQNVMQRKADVDYFQVTFSPRPEEDGSFASFLIESNAKFKNDNFYNANDAEFRQDVATIEILQSFDGINKINVNEDWHDDGYNRASDPKMYEGNVLTATDVPGYDQDNPINSGDFIDFTFKSKQKIVDTSENDKVIATTGEHVANIKGEYPRYFTMPLPFYYVPDERTEDFDLSLSPKFSSNFSISENKFISSVFNKLQSPLIASLNPSQTSNGFNTLSIETICMKVSKDSYRTLKDFWTDIICFTNPGRWDPKSYQYEIAKYFQSKIIKLKPIETIDLWYTQVRRLNKKLEDLLASSPFPIPADL